MTTLKPPFPAQDMNGLYKRVLKGAYPEIPKKYTKDLSDVIMRMLSVEPRLRPNCMQILDMEQVKKKINKLYPQEQSPSELSREHKYDKDEYNSGSDANRNELLNTIKVPQNLA